MVTREKEEMIIAPHNDVHFQKLLTFAVWGISALAVTVHVYYINVVAEFVTYPSFENRVQLPDGQDF